MTTAKRMRLSTCLAVLVLAATVLGPATAKDAAPGPNDACLMCHADAGAKSASGKSVAVDAKQFAGSVHGAMSLACTTCHADSAVAQVPHGKVAPAQCASCHDKAVSDYAKTVHGLARAVGKPVAFSRDA